MHIYLILGAKNQQNYGGIVEKSNLWQSSDLKIFVFGPFFGGCGRQYALWHVVTAAGLLSQRMIVSAPAAANTQTSNIPSESRSPPSKQIIFHVTGTTFH